MKEAKAMKEALTSEEEKARLSEEAKKLKKKAQEKAKNEKQKQEEKKKNDEKNILEALTKINASQQPSPLKPAPLKPVPEVKPELQPQEEPLKNITGSTRDEVNKNLTAAKIPNLLYYESQQSSECGAHAMNNLLQNVMSTFPLIFDYKDNTSLITSNTVDSKYNLDMKQYCNLIWKHIRESEVCPNSGYYSDDMLQYLFKFSGFKVTSVWNTDINNKAINDMVTKILGLNVNKYQIGPYFTETDTKPFFLQVYENLSKYKCAIIQTPNPNHWTAVFLKDAVWYRVNSLHPAVSCTTSLEVMVDYITERWNTQQVILVDITNFDKERFNNFVVSLNTIDIIEIYNLYLKQV